MVKVDVNGVLAGLKKFQRDTVEHVFEQLYGDSSATGSHKFLVADETGLGKSIVARGLIAKVIEHLSAEESAADHINIVYICSNMDLAAQNLTRLNVTGDRHVSMTTRLTLLARETHRLASEEGGAKKVNLISFTPGTSFSQGGWRQGSAKERAMLVFFLDLISNKDDPAKKNATRILLTGNVKSPERFDRNYVQPLIDSIGETYDQRIENQFRRLITRDGTLEQFERLRDDPRLRGGEWSDEYWNSAQNVMGRLRSALAKAGVEVLEPDLIILDEFQRFKHLLDPAYGEAAELAHELFDHQDARVLLLSATPYKPFTGYGESEDDHVQDFLGTLRFLLGKKPGQSRLEGGIEGNQNDVVLPVQRALRTYRTALSNQADAKAEADDVRRLLLPVMSRAERPPIGERTDLVQVKSLGTPSPSAEDIAEWARLADLGRLVGSRVEFEYWKSIPYFANFMLGYKVDEKLKEALEGSEADRVATALGEARSLDAAAVERFESVDYGNGHLRQLAQRTVGQGWWKLLWVPPTMPYLEPGDVYRKFAKREVTKQVVFSAWTGAPKAIASLLSYEADRRAAGNLEYFRAYTPEARKQAAPRLRYRITADRAAAMSTLAMFWPHQGVAFKADELEVARAAGGRVSARSYVQNFGPLGESSTGQPWETFFSVPGFVPEAFTGDTAGELASRVATFLSEEHAEDSTAGSGRTSFIEHVDQALQIGQTLTTPGAHLDRAAARIAAFSPGNIALRALSALSDGSQIPEEDLWAAAFSLAEGLRTLFNRPETIALLDTLYPSERVYWRSVLRYCADGNLRAVLDEYLYQLHSETGFAPLNSSVLMSLVRRAVDALTLRSVRYVAHATDAERTPIAFTSGFAVRYGSELATDESGGVRMGEVRNAFNSPFAPFVLATTSVGQEGIDFHWWSHALVHWNLPSNPVDFEQREGRVNRFGGHAVRKNIAEAHWADVVSCGEPQAWRAAMRVAESTENRLGEFSPWWMYPGDARIERVLAQYPLSHDIARYERLRTALTRYRLTLGQPRQEDLIQLLAQREKDQEDIAVINLRAPEYGV